MVEQLYEPLCEKNGGLISIKFEEMRQKLPLSLIFEGKDSIALIISALVCLNQLSHNIFLDLFSYKSKVSNDTVSASSKVIRSVSLSQGSHCRKLSVLNFLPFIS